MPDSRLAIKSLVHGPLPPSPPVPKPELSLPSYQQHWNNTPSSRTPTSPQTIIVKTARGKRHRCTFDGCGRDFTRLSNLKAHWRRHSGEEPYSCMHCTRKFKWRSSLKSHELGCVYEFTKANAGLRWVYVATDDPPSRQSVHQQTTPFRQYEQRFVPNELASISRQMV